MRFATGHGYDVLELSYSPITGGEGNIEFLAHLKKAKDEGTLSPTIDVVKIVEQAHEQFNHK